MRNNQVSNLKAALLRNNLITKRDLMKMYQPPNLRVSHKFTDLYVSSKEDPEKLKERLEKKLE